MIKPLFRIPAAVAASLFLTGASFIYAADEDPRHSAAEGLVTAMHVQQMVDSNLNRMLSLVDRFNQSAVQGQTLTPEQTDAIKKAEDEARNTIRKELGYDSIKEEFIKTYAEAFNEQELKELTSFYNSPVGQKVVEQQPQITEKVGRVAQQKMGTVMPGVVQKLREAVQNNLPPPPAPPTVVPAPLMPPAGAIPPAPPVPPVPVPSTANPAAPAPPKAPVPPAPPTTVTTPPVSAPVAPAVPTPLPPTPAAPNTPVQ